MKQATHKSISVMLVDDHPVVRDGYRHLLETEPDISVVAEVSSGEICCCEYKKYLPNVLVLDLSMPGIGGLETMRRVKAYDPNAHILVFSMHASEAVINHALQAGATGYLAKQSGIGQMVKAVREVAQGVRFIDAKYASGASNGVSDSSPGDPLHALSPREFQVFKLIAEGHSVSDIASVLSISPKTAGVHHTNIMKKLGLNNTSQIVRLAIRCNVIEP